MRAVSTASAALPDDAPHLLVVDDDRRIRDLLSRFLFAEGYRVTTAETAADARAKLGGLRFDLLILDVMMPGETGFDLARDLRASSSVPIIMLTARDEAHSRIEGLTIGADDYVSKPFEPRELSLRIAGILRRARPRLRYRNRCASVGSGSTSSAASSSAAKRSCGSPIASAKCCACSRRRLVRRSRGKRSPAMTARSGSAPSMCRSIACAARSSGIRPIRFWCKRCAGSDIAW